MLTPKLYLPSGLVTRIAAVNSIPAGMMRPLPLLVKVVAVGTVALADAPNMVANQASNPFTSTVEKSSDDSDRNAKSDVLAYNLAEWSLSRKVLNAATAALSDK